MEVVVERREHCLDKRLCTPDFSQAMEVVVERARNLAKGDSSIIFVFEKQSNSFTVGGWPPASRGSIASAGCLENLARDIIATRNGIRVDDTQQCPDLKSLVPEGVRSLAGVCVQEQIGVLFVTSQRVAQFTDHHVRLLQTLANQASLALGWLKLLKSSEVIEQATPDLFRLEAILQKACEELQSSFGFEFAAVQLVRPEGRTIETVIGTGTAKAWSRRGVGHYLSDYPGLRDIQADIVATRHIEVIAGWDNRFDRWVYEEFRHNQLVRIFAPVILVRNENGAVMSDWFEHCKWSILSEENNEKGQHTVIEMCLPLVSPDRIEVIGTVETGYQDPNKRINKETAIALTELAARQALDIRRALLPYVLETILECAMSSVRADSASFHFHYQPEPGRYIYECARGVGWRSIRDFPTRKEQEGGLGRQAVHEGQPKFVPKFVPETFEKDEGAESEFKEYNPNLFNEGIRAIAAFPLLVGDKDGVLYLQFRRPQRWTQADISWVQFFLNRAITAIRYVTSYTDMRDRARQLASLHSVFQSLFQLLVGSPQAESLLRRIAWSTLNMLAADVVTIYEYNETERRFSSESPHIAGRLKVPEAMGKEIHEDDVPALLIKNGLSIVYAPRSLEDHLFCGPDREQSPGQSLPFVKRENIESSAGILLKVGPEIVGVMFINYRRAHHSFTDDEQIIISTLASSVAIAIQNQRLLETFIKAGDYLITIPDLQQILELIVQWAVQITHADLGTIYVLDSDGQALLMRARHPASAPDSSYAPIAVGQGIIGWVAKHGQPFLSGDITDDPRCDTVASGILSQLCVPLRDGGGHVLGVLTVLSPQTEAFTSDHQERLKALANSAVIAIQNARHDEQRRKEKTVAAISDFGANFAHRVSNLWGTVPINFQAVKDAIAGEDKLSLSQHLKLLEDGVNRVVSIQRVAKLLKTSKDERHLLSINEIIKKAAEEYNKYDNIKVKPELNEELPLIQGNELYAEEIFTNLIDNAINAMPPEGGKVRLLSQLSKDQKWIVIKVEDNGAGMPEAVRARMFEPFYTTNRDSLGLGSWLAHQAVQAMAGKIDVESQHRKGTTVTIQLPIQKGV